MPKKIPSKPTPINPVPIKIYTVTFISDGIVIKTQQVEYGKAAVAPVSPTKNRYIFTGWDKEFDNVTGDLVVNAEWEATVYMITFEKIKEEFLVYLNIHHSWATKYDVDLRYINSYSKGVALVVMEPMLSGMEVIPMWIGGYQFHEGNPVMFFYVFETSEFLHVHRNYESVLLTLLSQEELCDLSLRTDNIWRPSQYDNAE